MRLPVLASLLLYAFFGHSQQAKIEESAMDYYLMNIHQNGEKLKSTGRLEIEEGPGYGAFVVTNFLGCKLNSAKGDSARSAIYRREYARVTTRFSGTVDTLGLSRLRLPLKEPIKLVGRVRYKKLRGGVIGFGRRVMSGVFGESFNVHFFRCVIFEGYYYSMIEVVKKDGEYGRQFWFKQDNRGEVIDWCEGGWIQ